MRFGRWDNDRGGTEYQGTVLKSFKVGSIGLFKLQRLAQGAEQDL